MSEDRNERRYRSLRIVFKNGMETMVSSRGGFRVSSQDGQISEIETPFAALPYHDPNTIAAIISEGGEEGQGICPHPSCMKVITGPTPACREHWYALPNHIREPWTVALNQYARDKSDQALARRQGAEEKAQAAWLGQLGESE